MKQIALKPPRTFVIQENEVPKPGPGEVLLRMTKVGICGSDMHLYRKGRIGQLRMNTPLVLGHECTGEVVETGEGVDKKLMDRRVAIEPTIHCGKCQWCQKGLINVCPYHTFLGLPPQAGGLQEYIIHPAVLVEPLPENISDNAGVVLEPLAIAQHAINLMKIKPGQKIIILGTGVLGTCVLTLLKLYSDITILCIDLRMERLVRAKQLCTDFVIQANEGKKEELLNESMDAFDGIGADIVFECAGVEETLWNMCELATPGGHIAVIGSNPDDKVSFSSGSARRKGLTLRFVRRSLNTLPTVLKLTEEGKIHPEKLVTHILPASKVDNGFKMVDTYSDNVLKVLIDMKQW